MNTAIGRIATATAALASALLLSARADAQISLDTSFGVSGVARTAFGTTNSDTPYDVLLQPDGQILTAGISVSGFDYYIAMTRHSADGVLDSTGFGTDGKVLTHFTLRDQASAIALQDDGKIVAVGMQATSNAGSAIKSSIYRFHPNGTIDDTFALVGWDSIRYDLVSSGEFAGVKVLPDGRVLAAGRCNSNANGGTSGFGVMRFLSDGSLDAAFDGDGRRRLSYSVTYTRGSCAFLENGGILWANTAFLNGRQEFAMARVDSAGATDVSFGTNGIVAPGIQSSNNQGVRVLALADGKFLLAGSTPKDASSNPQFSVFRFLADGTIDDSFGTNGRTDVSFSTGGDVCYDMAVYGDGKILLTGYGNGQSAFARLLPDGVPDSTFSGDGRFTTNISSSTNYFTRSLVLPDGKILAAGYDFGSNGGDFFLARFVDDPTGVEGSGAAPARVLALAYPNPSRVETVLRLELPRADFVRVEIFDVAGRAVRRVHDGSLPAGAHALRWDGRDKAGAEAPSGVFFARISTPGHMETTKLIRLR